MLNFWSSAIVPVDEQLISHGSGSWKAHVELKPYLFLPMKTNITQVTTVESCVDKWKSCPEENLCLMVWDSRHALIQFGQLLLFSLFYLLIVHSLNDQLPKPVASPYLQFGVFCSVVVNYLLLTYCLKTQTFPYFLHCLVNFFFSFTFFSSWTPNVH